MTVEFRSGIYGKEHLEHKDKQHRDNLFHIRRFIVKTQKAFSGNHFKLENGEDWLSYTPFMLLYDVAKLTDWINQVDYNLKTFLCSYLTEEEKQLFHVVFRQWVLETVEYTIGSEEGIVEEDDKPVIDQIKEQYEEYDGTTVPPYIENLELTHKKGRQLAVHFKLFTVGEKGSINYMRDYPLAEVHDLIHIDHLIDGVDEAICQQLQLMFELETAKYEDGIKKEEVDNV